MPIIGNGTKGGINTYHIYPLTILCDRYQGSYSGGLYTVWNCSPGRVPSDVYSDDDSCADFWRNSKEDRTNFPFGVGNTIQEAIDDLYYHLDNPLIEAKWDVWWPKSQLENLVGIKEDYHDIVFQHQSLSWHEAEEALEKYEIKRDEFMKHKEECNEDES